MSWFGKTHKHRTNNKLTKLSYRPIGGCFKLSSAWPALNKKLNEKESSLNTEPGELPSPHHENINVIATKCKNHE